MWCNSSLVWVCIKFSIVVKWYDSVMMQPSIFCHNNQRLRVLSARYHQFAYVIFWTWQTSFNWVNDDALCLLRMWWPFVLKSVHFQSNQIKIMWIMVGLLIGLYVVTTEMTYTFSHFHWIQNLSQVNYPKLATWILSIWFIYLVSVQDYMCLLIIVCNIVLIV